MKKKVNAMDVISDFAALANLPNFALDERGMARLQLDGAMLIDFEHDPNQNVLHLYSSIGPAPFAGGETALRLLLEANLFQDRSLGTAFALDSGTGEFMACARLELETLNGQRLVTHVERMAAAVEKIREELDGLSRSSDGFAENRLSVLANGLLPG
ncbi:type III secretion system chaperone [Noviherbaspirillum pedocola]|uniref:Type III secretion system chaperone n=1 Tax=Noviherbaspirillum pedocola TaxID=2801341 RepID=A0A934SVY6_9BURK|nr:type III secretion system chaperone [Noviherbaspirillum pedocola]MBK4736383.1 type III secretion system chaperone [Noviherbaspirillum pedocola]